MTYVLVKTRRATATKAMAVVAIPTGYTAPDVLGGSTSVLTWPSGGGITYNESSMAVVEDSQSSRKLKGKQSICRDGSTNDY